MNSSKERMPVRSKFSSTRDMAQHVSGGSVVNNITSGAFNQSQFKDVAIKNKQASFEPPVIQTNRKMGKANFSGQKIAIDHNPAAVV